MKIKILLFLLPFVFGIGCDGIQSAMREYAMGSAYEAKLEEQRNQNNNTSSGNTSNPSNPTNPSNPSDPSNPTNPTEPTNPSLSVRDSKARFEGYFDGKHLVIDFVFYPDGEFYSAGLYANPNNPEIITNGYNEKTIKLKAESRNNPPSGMEKKYRVYIEYYIDGTRLYRENLNSLLRPNTDLLYWYLDPQYRVERSSVRYGRRLNGYEILGMFGGATSVVTAAQDYIYGINDAGGAAKRIDNCLTGVDQYLTLSFNPGARVDLNVVFLYAPVAWGALSEVFNAVLHVEAD